MPEAQWEGEAAPDAPLPSAVDRLRVAPGLAELVAEAEATWRSRSHALGDSGGDDPRWRAFEDAFPTFWEFSNRPR